MRKSRQPLPWIKFGKVRNAATSAVAQPTDRSPNVAEVAEAWLQITCPTCAKILGRVKRNPKVKNEQGGRRDESQLTLQS